MTRKYELMYILSPNIGDEKTQALDQRIKDMVEGSATIDNVDIWGKKRLAYEINDETEGHYGLINFSSEDASFPRELERNLNFIDDVMRYLVIRTED